MKYSIGEFASIVGVSPDTLRLYEKHDIIRPIKNNQNNYRFFNDLDARDLLMSRWYRSMQIPLYEVASLMKEASSDEIVDKVNEAQQLLEAEIQRSAMLLNKMKEIHEELGQIRGSMYQCQIRQLPGRYRIKQTYKNDLLKQEELKYVVQDWMEKLPYTYYSFRMENKDQTIGYDVMDYSWGLTLLEEDSLRLNVAMNDSVEYLPPETCVSAVIVRSQEEYISSESFRFMLDYIEEHGYSIVGDITGKILLNEKLGEHSRTYLEIYIPIRAIK
ncbi:MerR family transcriptional regulator [Paenibacillus lentus]|uniref:MerR family transcriptional regulator n=1 Tax=Paenibacillus lentus TaxID=1338368 RepID=UPI003659C82D